MRLAPRLRLPALRRGVRSPARGRRGVAALYAALLGLVLIGFLALSIDAGYTVRTLQQLHSAADAAALAAAAQVKADSALGASFPLTRQAAVDTARLNQAANADVLLDPNLGNAPGGDVVVGWWDPVTKTFNPYDPNIGLHDAVRVRARRTSGSPSQPLALFFGGIFGKPDIEISRSSTAQIGWPAQVLVLALGDVAQSLDLSGNPSLNVPTGIVQVDSGQPGGLQGSGSASLTALKIRVNGPSYVGGTFTPTPRVNWPKFGDPLASIPDPPFTPPPKPAIKTGGAYPPGYYQFLELKGSEVVTLSAGVYVFGRGPQKKGRGVELKGTAQLRSTGGVTLFLVDTATLDIGGTAGIQLLTPGAGPWQGVTVFTARPNTGTSSIQGNGTCQIEGTLYMPRGHLDLGGNPGKEIGRIIAGTITLSGNSGLTVTGKGVPPPAGPQIVSLVE